MQRARGSCPNRSSNGDVEGILCPPLPCCFPLQPLQFSLCRAEESLQAVPAPAQHIPLARAEVSTQSLQVCVAVVEFALQEIKSIQKETQKLSLGQLHKSTEWKIIGAGNYQSLSFQHPQPCSSQQHFSLKN